MADNVHRIRPAGRHILTIGRDLIQDQYAAIVELVKNAYDADSPDVLISFQGDKEKNSFSIVVEDSGHGMTKDVVVNQWLVPSTDDKLKRKNSPNGRVMQGRKGVGRYAASILGNDLLLETVDSEGQQTTIYIEWKIFEHSEFLDDVEVLVDYKKTSHPPSTRLTITADHQHLLEWDDKQFKKLIFELKKLMSPVAQELSTDDFLITLNISGFGELDSSEIIKPYPIFDLYDYKISGVVTENGEGTFKYENQKARNSEEEIINLKFPQGTNCGSLTFNFRVYDRDKDAIDELIHRGLKNKQGDFLGKLEARQLLNDYNGIAVYRNDFRIRPMGDPDFDWLKLNHQRVQNPSLKIGSNQVIGYVQIQAEELSGLEEKSARDGLKENKAYEMLREISLEVISKLEDRRFAYRKKAGLSRKAVSVERQLESLFAFDDLKKKLHVKLTKSGISESAADEIIEIVSKEEKEKNKIVDEIRQAVAIYQGQATLGKIINVVLHEGRRPLNFFKNQIPNLNFWAKELTEKRDPEILDEILPISVGLGEHAEAFVALFSRLDPLAAGKRGKKRDFHLADVINKSLMVFEQELIGGGIQKKVSCPKELKVNGWVQDFQIILTNLIENTIYWAGAKKTASPEIIIDVLEEDGEFIQLDYRDNGPGIEPHLIKNSIVFDHEFSTKPNGTGLGLAIAGEASSRNGLELLALASDSGVYFRLQVKRREGDE